MTCGINFNCSYLDDRQHWLRHGIDPDELLKSHRDEHDREGARRGLMFVGEVRKGKEIQRQYIVPTFWWWLRFCLLKPRLQKPRKGTR